MNKEVICPIVIVDEAEEIKNPNINSSMMIPYYSAITSNIVSQKQLEYLNNNTLRDYVGIGNISHDIMMNYQCTKRSLILSILLRNIHLQQVEYRQYIWKCIWVKHYLWQINY